MEKLAGQQILEALHTRFNDFEAALNGKAQTEAHAIRKAAFDLLNQNGLPHAKHEEYKYTNLTKALEKHVSFNDKPSKTKNIDTSSFTIPGLEAYQLIFINGILNTDLSDDLSSVAGVSLKLLTEDIYEASSLFNQAVADSEDSFVAMNTAFAQHGISIHIADQVVLDKPIVLHYVGDQKEYSIRNLFSCGRLSQATFIEKVDSVNDALFTNIVNEIKVEEQADIKYFKIENDQDESLHVANTFVTQLKDSKFTANTIALNGQMIRNNLNIQLEAEGCEAYMNGLYLLNGKSHVDNHTVVDHKKPNAYSNELYKGIMDDKSTGVFNGKIFVRQDAQKTNAFQSNKNILLTNDATVNTKPQLEIWADDVKCSHGCTTGQIDKDALFYLQARGIKKDKAMAILLHAFASDVLENFENKAIQDYVEAIITKRLEK